MPACSIAAIHAVPLTAVLHLPPSSLEAERRLHFDSFPDVLDRLKRAQMHYLWLPVTDTHAPTVDQIVQGLAWIEQHVRTGRKVYIHCAAGMGRSVTLLACWYLYTGSMNVSQVLTFVKRRRPQTSLRRRQVWRIQEIATLLTHTAGKLPVQVSL